MNQREQYLKLSEAKKGKLYHKWVKVRIHEVYGVGAKSNKGGYGNKYIGQKAR